MGMLNNPWFRVKVHRSDKAGELQCSSVRFEHPTLAGQQNGGWMQRFKEHPALVAPVVFNPHNDALKDVDSSVAVASVALAAVSLEPEAVTFDPSKPSFTAEEVREHNSKESSWIIVKNKVYDCTPFLKDHPGGAESILIMAGEDSSEDFEAVHSKKAWKMLEQYYIGQLRPSDASNVPSIPAPSAGLNSTDTLIALNPKLRIPFTLVEREMLSHDSIRMKFALQSPRHILGLPVGQHMYMQYIIV